MTNPKNKITIEDIIETVAAIRTLGKTGRALVSHRQKLLGFAIEARKLAIPESLLDPQDRADDIASLLKDVEHGPNASDVERAIAQLERFAYKLESKEVRIS